MKTILIVGGYGFLGTNILKYIDSNLVGRYKVIVFDKFAGHLYGETFTCLDRSYAGDFMDSSCIEGIFDENDIDIVIHALSTTYPLGGYNPKYDIESNLLPTLSLMDTMVRHDVKDIVFFSSGGAVYGNSENAHEESEDVFPISSYGVVKHTTEKYMIQYAKLFGMRPMILRISNPYGEYHYSMKQGICNVAIASAIQGKVFKVFGDGNSTKDYIYVRDFVEILFRLIDKGVFNQVVNIASGQLVSINDILVMIRRSFPDFKWEYSTNSPFDVAKFALKTDKLKELIGEFRFTSFEDGIGRTIQWAKDQSCR